MKTAFLTLTTCLLVLPAYARYSGGRGTADDPYQIATAADLMTLGETSADYDKHFILTADIDLDPKLPGRKVFGGSVIPLLTGVFDGNDHRISHLTIVGGGCLGLFGQLGWDYQIQPYGEPTCTVKNLAVEDVNIIGSDDDVGALAARIEWAVVSHSRSTGRVRGKDAVGGLVGYNQYTVIDCHSRCTVAGDSWIGGLVGNTYGSVIDCYSIGAVSGSAEVGGLVGMHRGSITQSYSAGTVSGRNAVGGLVGRNGILGRSPQPGDIDRSYSTAAVRGETYVGGLIGDDWYGSVRQCYSTGAVSGNVQAGGLIGRPAWSLDVTASFWDVAASGLTVSGAGQGKTTTQMQTASTFLSAGWDFVGETANGLHETWQMPEGGGYPILSVFNGYIPPRLRGQGTREEPYLISDAKQLGALIHYSPSAHYRLIASLDLAGIRWARAVIPYFAGMFDGGGHTIAHLTVAGSEALGLFAGLDQGCEVKDLGIVDVNIVGSGLHGGGLARYNWGAVTRCYTTGAVGGVGAVGGLVGSNTGTLTCCYSTATVTGTAWAGGLVGRNSGKVTKCYSTGAVFSGSYSNGLVGYNSGSVTNSFWDTDTSGLSVSSGGTGKTTTEMHKAKTFLDAGWDFVGETKNGIEDIWWIDEGKDYPRLWWEARN